MHRWLPLAACLLLFGCSENEKDAPSDDDASESKKKKKKKKKTKKSGKPDVQLVCSTKDLGYLDKSKTSEALNTIGAISRGAAAAYERERAATEEGDLEAAHALCKSAQPVPADGPPKGKKYQPNTADGSDFETGDAETGWRCLKFALTQPHYFQYGYNAGGGYKSTELGLPDPGPDGFEAWAMGDLDGDGRPSLFVYTGKVNKETQTLKRNTSVSCVDPGE